LTQLLTILEVKTPRVFSQVGKRTDLKADAAYGAGVAKALGISLSGVQK